MKHKILLDNDLKSFSKNKAFRGEEGKSDFENDEKIFRSLFENNPVETVIVDREARVIGYNHAKKKRDEKLPRISDVMYRDYAGNHEINMLEELKDCLKTGRSKEFPEQFYKGRYLHIRISPFPAGAIITSIDITYAKRVEDALKESENRYRTLVHTIPHGIQEIDTKGVITFANPAFNKIFDYDDGELIGKSMLDLILEESERKETRLFLENLLHNQPSPVPYLNKCITKSGRIIHVQTDWNYKLDKDAAVRGFISIITDITKRMQALEDKKKLERQLRHSQKLEAIGTLAGGIAHDFNNILGSILLNSELAVDEADQLGEDGEITYSLNQIIKGTYRAKDLVEQILTFSRESEVERKPLKISPIIKETVKMLRAMLPSTVVIEQDINDDTGTVLADPAQIQQLVINLCNNAAQSMEKTGGKLKITLSRKNIETPPSESNLHSGNYVSIMVEDEGCGMDSDIKERVFDPFFTTKRPGEGSGLGLSVVHGIIVNHEGEIMLSSRKGKGTRIEAFLPIIDGTMVSQEKEDTESVPTGRERILFVDDEEVVVDANKRILEKLGYELTCALSSTEALEIFKEYSNDFDLVITDMTMPHMTGAELSSELLLIRPDIPIILCTGYSHLITPEKAISMGIREFLMKPLSMHEIAAAIRKVLD